MNKFAMFCNARSGSTSLLQYFRLLGVEIIDEPLQPDIWRGEHYDVDEELTKLYLYYDALKHLYTHLSIKKNLEFVQYHLDGGYKVLYLKRRNLVMQAISEALASNTGFWEVERRDKEQYAQLVSETPLSIETIQDTIEWTVRHEEAYDPVLTGPSVQIAYYEDVFLHGLETMRGEVDKIREFLDIPLPSETASALTAAEFLGSNRKQNDAAIYRLIPNRQEIEQYFGASLSAENETQ